MRGSSRRGAWGAPMVSTARSTSSSPRPRLLTLGTPTDLGEIVRRRRHRRAAGRAPAGCETREAAEALHGQPLRVALADAPALEPGEWWAHELEGCA